MQHHRCYNDELPRLQHSREAQAGTGCHEGGIILSTKPPERHLSLPPQRSASDSNFRSGKEEWFRLQRSWWQRSSASDSNLRSGKEEWFRLQQPWRTQAGTGCHEGGIILIKKPPEWHLFLPQQRYASDSNFVASKKNGLACSGCCGNREWFLRLQL